MTPTEFLKDRNIVAEDKTDLIIGFDNGTKESLIELLDSYHKAKLKLLGIGVVVLSDCDYGHNTLNKNDEPCKLMCCVKKEDYEQ